MTALVLLLGAPNVEIACSTLAVDRSELLASVAREVGDVDVVLACEGDAVRVTIDGRSFPIPLADVPAGAKARTIALAIAEEIRTVEARRSPPVPTSTITVAPPPEVSAAVQVERRASGWSLAPSLDGFATADADGLFAGAAFEVTKSIPWVSFFAGAMLGMGRADQKATMLLSFRTGIAADFRVTDTLTLDLNIRVDGGPLIGFGGNPGLQGYIAYGPGAGLRWAFERLVHLRVLFGVLFLPPLRPLFTLSVGIGFELFGG